jgi:hypothetical protein
MKNSLDFGLKLRPSNIENLAPGMQDDFVAQRKIRPVEANRLPQLALDTVPRHRVPNRPRRGKADPSGVRRPRRPDKSREQRTTQPYAFVVDFLELGSAAKAPGPWKTLGSGPRMNSVLSARN